MNGRGTDIAIVGGGLSGGLIALALHRANPDLKVKLLESGPAIGGNHRWSWFESDLGTRESELLGLFPTKSWDSYDVHFPAHSRTLATRYTSLASSDFARALENALPQGTIQTDAAVAQIGQNSVTLASGEQIEAAVVIDCRGVTSVDGLCGGWQTFLGRHFRTDQPHGLTRPIVMDATVEQVGGYRFVYVLPFSPDEIFIEDTYYADTAAIDEDELSRRIDAYCAERGWSGEEISRETGALPVISAGDFGQWQSNFKINGVARAGARGGFLHPLTSYTIPIAAQTAVAIAQLFERAGQFKKPSQPFDGVAAAAWIEAQAKRHWRSTGFYRMLGMMLFGAARPEERYRIFQRFYRLPEPLIERFYAARSTLFDRARILSGKPPVPISAALRSLFSQKPPLKFESSK